MAAANPRQLVVEGYDDLSCVAEIMGHYIPWPEARDQAPVHIRRGGSPAQIIDPDYLSVVVKSPGLKAAGIVIDADGDPTGRYRAVAKAVASMFPELPDVPSPTGVVTQNQDGLRFGVWVMPDNQCEGHLESFLPHFVAAQHSALWALARTAVEGAVSAGAPVRAIHSHKAHLYTWLAWLDPPGQYPSHALKRKDLEAGAPYGSAFAAWFRELFQL